MYKSIGIIGGMGPLATADIFQKIILSTDASCDNDHIRIFIDCNSTIPDRSEAILRGGREPVPEIAKTIEILTNCGADCLIMPCNTSHYYLPRLKLLTNIPIISILDATAEACAIEYPGKTAGLLGTKALIHTGVYDEVLKKEGINFVIPDDDVQDLVNECIYAVKSGADICSLRENMERIISELKADYFILGCTELPIIVETLKLAINYIDPTQKLAEAAIKFCGYRVKGMV